MFLSWANSRNIDFLFSEPLIMRAWISMMSLRLSCAAASSMISSSINTGVSVMSRKPAFSIAAR